MLETMVSIHCAFCPSARHASVTERDVCSEIADKVAQDHRARLHAEDLLMQEQDAERIARGYDEIGNLLWDDESLTDCF